LHRCKKSERKQLIVSIDRKKQNSSRRDLR